MKTESGSGFSGKVVVYRGFRKTGKGIAINASQRGAFERWPFTGIRETGYIIRISKKHHVYEAISLKQKREKSSFPDNKQRKVAVSMIFGLRFSFTSPVFRHLENRSNHLKIKKKTTTKPV